MREIHEQAEREPLSPPGALRVERFGGATLYLGDCREIVPRLPRHDALISDPPYGQRQNATVTGANPEITVRGCAQRRSFNDWGAGIQGDEVPFNPGPWLAAADRVLLWGAHKFSASLPPGTWLVWDKVPTGKVRDQGDGEAAWVNDQPPRPMRIHRLLWDGFCVGAAAKNEVSPTQKRLHPMQKPVVLMAWCLEQARAPAGSSILDPFMGAGSTGIAALRAGHTFTGIEIEPRYFDAACRRIEAEFGR